MDIYNEFLNGNHRALAKLITAVENFDDDGFEILTKLEEHFRNKNGNPASYLAPDQAIIGITGPPGAGKSTLVDKISREILNKEPEAKIAIIAFDPSSPFTGGAILGDRVRMSNFTSPNLYFRSMGTRGALGGMSRCIPYVLRIYELFGFNYIIVETVGVGQLEIEVAKMTDTTIVTEVPGLGDEVQAIKAGLFEIGDIFVINKSDRTGVEKVYTEINYMLKLREDKNREDGIVSEWSVPIVKTNCISGDGVSEVIEKIKAHDRYMKKSGLFADIRKKRLREQYFSFIKDFTEERLNELLGENVELESLVENGTVDFSINYQNSKLRKIVFETLTGISKSVS
ncbi:MAG: methylmalonyl Co-A mutase-associated GTPase MeaB [Candidatus Wallbacteria bacterium]